MVVSRWIMPLVGVLSLSAQASPSFEVLQIDQELLGYYLDAAARYTPYERLSPSEVPPIYVLSKQELSQEICPDHPLSCYNMAAIYDTDRNRILVRNDLNMADDTDGSFLVHELVHVMQYRKNGEAIYKDCEALKKTESEAYQAQDAYLKERGELFQAGNFMHFFQCNDRSLE